MKHFLEINNSDFSTIKIKSIFFILTFFLFSCQPTEKLDDVVLNYNNIPKITINAEQIKINNLYESKFDEPFIDHSVDKPPILFLNKWLDKNISIFGSENLFVVNVFESSLKKSEIPNIDKKKYQEDSIFLYEVNFLVEFILYDDANFILASSIVESKRTTTSGKYISLHDSSVITESLIIDSLIDFTNKTKELITQHMHNYIL